jgi:hypothetical protein
VQEEGVENKLKKRIDRTQRATGGQRENERRMRCRRINNRLTSEAQSGHRQAGSK